MLVLPQSRNKPSSRGTSIDILLQTRIKHSTRLYACLYFPSPESNRCAREASLVPQQAVMPLYTCMYIPSPAAGRPAAVQVHALSPLQQQGLKPLYTCTYFSGPATMPRSRYTHPCRPPAPVLLLAVNRPRNESLPACLYCLVLLHQRTSNEWDKRDTTVPDGSATGAHVRAGTDLSLLSPWRHACHLQNKIGSNAP